MPFIPKVGIILGTGFGRWINTLDLVAEINIADIPHMINPGVLSHKGTISFSVMDDVPVVLLQGRVHYYEGHEINEVVRALRVLQTIGCTHLIITNAAGGLNPLYDDGDIVILKDHINLMGINPLRGPNEERWGPRFPDMKYAYHPDWITYVVAAASELNIPLKTGVYAGNAGPSLETPAEYAFLHTIGADLVGMSAVPEVIAARHIGLSILALSIVSNVCYPPERIKETSIEDVIRVVEKSALDAGELIKAAVGFCRH